MSNCYVFLSEPRWTVLCNVQGHCSAYGCVQLYSSRTGQLQRGSVEPTVASHHRVLDRSVHVSERERERDVLFNDALNTFYLPLYGVRHMVKDHSDSE